MHLHIIKHTKHKCAQMSVVKTNDSILVINNYNYLDDRGINTSLAKKFFSSNV
jgi:hypothetical protein